MKSTKYLETLKHIPINKWNYLWDIRRSLWLLLPLYALNIVYFCFLIIIILYEIAVLYWMLILRQITCKTMLHKLYWFTNNPFVWFHTKFRKNIYCVQFTEEEPEAKEAFIIPHSQGETKAYLLVRVENIIQLHLTKEMINIPLTS